MVKKRLMLSDLLDSRVCGVPSLRVPVGLAVTLVGASASMASTPSPALIGVQRVIMLCDFGPGFTDAEERNLCTQLVSKAKQATQLPVTLGTAADRDPLASRDSKYNLILEVRADAKAVDEERRDVTVQVTPVRPGRPMGSMTPVTSSASLMRVQGRWALQGPIDAFHKILGSTRGAGLRAPVTSDR